MNRIESLHSSSAYDEGMDAKTLCGVNGSNASGLASYTSAASVGRSVHPVDDVSVHA
jgi:hypothetical protein